MIIAPFKRLNKMSKTALCSRGRYSQLIDFCISYQFTVFFLFSTSEIKAESLETILSEKHIAVLADSVDAAAGMGEKASISCVKYMQSVNRWSQHVWTHVSSHIQVLSGTSLRRLNAQCHLDSRDEGHLAECREGPIPRCQSAETLCSPYIYS